MKGAQEGGLLLGIDITDPEEIGGEMPKKSSWKSSTGTNYRICIR
jgi:hypothetical protein